MHRRTPPPPDLPTRTGPGMQLAARWVAAVRCRRLFARVAPFVAPDLLASGGLAPASKGWRRATAGVQTPVAHSARRGGAGGPPGWLAAAIPPPADRHKPRSLSAGTGAIAPTPASWDHRSGYAARLVVRCPAGSDNREFGRC